MEVRVLRNGRLAVERGGRAIRVGIYCPRMKEVVFVGRGYTKQQVLAAIRWYI